MTETWYRARFEKIEPIEIERETDKQVVFPNGKRENKVSDWTWYAKTREEAKALIVDKYKQEYEQAKNHLEFARNRLIKAEAL